VIARPSGSHHRAPPQPSRGAARPAGVAPAAAEHPQAAFFEDRRSRFALCLLTT